MARLIIYHDIVMSDVYLVKCLSPKFILDGGGIMGGACSMVGAGMAAMGCTKNILQLGIVVTDGENDEGQVIKK